MKLAQKARNREKFANPADFITHQANNLIQSIATRHVFKVTSSEKTENQIIFSARHNLLVHTKSGNNLILSGVRPVV